MSAFRPFAPRLRAAAILIALVLVTRPENYARPRRQLVAAQIVDTFGNFGGGGGGAGSEGPPETAAEIAPSLSYACPPDVASFPHSDSFDPCEQHSPRSPVAAPHGFHSLCSPLLEAEASQRRLSALTLEASHRLLPFPVPPPTSLSPIHPSPPASAFLASARRMAVVKLPSEAPQKLATLLSAKFISVGRLFEQLSKARLHLGEVLSVARHTGRTLILPSVGNSRIGTVADYAFPFCSYFDPVRLGQFVPWVSEEFFYGQVVPAWRREGRGEGSVVALVLGDGKMKACDVGASYAKIGRNTNTPGLQPNASFRALPSLLLNRALLSPALCTRSCTHKRRAKPPGAEDLLLQDKGATVLPGEEPMVALGKGGGEGGGDGGEEGGEKGEVGGRAGTEGRKGEGTELPDRNADVAVVFKASPLMCLSRIGRLAAKARHSLVYPAHLHLIADQFIAKHFQGSDGGAMGREVGAEVLRRMSVEDMPQSRPRVFVAAHWRLEKALRAGVRSQQMAACVRGLVGSVREWERRVLGGGDGEGEGDGERRRGEKSEEKVEREDRVGVFLATDLTPDNRWMSNSFTVLSREHREVALRTVQLLHQELQPITWAAADPAIVQLDTGVQAILDKLLCIKSTVFLHAPVTCTNAHDPHGSSFTEEICGSRETINKEARGIDTDLRFKGCTTWDVEVV